MTKRLGIISIFTIILAVSAICKGNINNPKFYFYGFWIIVILNAIIRILDWIGEKNQKDF